MFTVHAGSEGVLIVGAKLIVTLNGLSPQPPTVSVARTVKLNVPVAEGVPESNPAALSVKPVGSGNEPGASPQLSAPVPPVAVSVVAG